ncbi:uncharacterized protein HD556DRAFT_100803 [Suillus plorans]|uniref:Uncharacterized protein n=1 Tax=Suillus plorans TaxID=116603 RepID=A0A9P7DB48_9AGAM|nr:uncharacterized protein HD556DRAFT_100803 [Suillus plorans]KAG1785718.1 hypothetical protein HD556DRAFT_100803 [Suillus plorans]
MNVFLRASLRDNRATQRYKGFTPCINCTLNTLQRSLLLTSNHNEAHFIFRLCCHCFAADDRGISGRQRCREARAKGVPILLLRTPLMSRNARKRHSRILLLRTPLMPRSPPIRHSQTSPPRNPVMSRTPLRNHSHTLLRRNPVMLSPPRRNPVKLSPSRTGPPRRNPVRLSPSRTGPPRRAPPRRLSNVVCLEYHVGVSTLFKLLAQLQPKVRSSRLSPSWTTCLRYGAN